MVIIFMPDKREWNRQINPLKNYAQGNLRGIQGAGNEQLVASRALKHGFIVFLRIWSDAKYDMVIECEGELFRVQVKGTQNMTISASGGQRGGIQRPISKIRRYTRNDCDVIVGVDSNTGDCYVFPIDYITSLDKSNVKLTPEFLERWDYITGNAFLSINQAKDGLSPADLQNNLRKILPQGTRLPTKLEEMKKLFYEKCPKP